MTCATCGAVGVAGATWCTQCYLPYARAGGSQPPPGVPVFAAPRPVMVPAPVNAFAGPPGAGPAGFPPPSFAPPVHSPQYPPPAAGWPATLGLVVPQIAVETGDLPHICVVSGRPTDNFVKMRWAWAPRWSLLLGLLIRLIVSDRVAGYLPIHPTVRRQLRWVPVAAVLALFVGVLTMAIGFGGNQPVIGFAGVAAMVASVVAVLRQGRRLPVRRASEGFIAFPKASPEFAAAFRAGRPPQQQPFAARPAKYDITTATKVGIGVVVAFVGLGVVLNIRDDVRCNGAGEHRNVSTVVASLNASDSAANAREAADQGQGMTEAEGRQQLTEDDHLARSLVETPLSASDASARDSYVTALTSYDDALRAALENPAVGDRVGPAGSKLVASELSLRHQLASVPAACTQP